MTRMTRLVLLPALLAVGACASAPEPIIRQVEDRVTDCGTVGWQAEEGRILTVTEQRLRAAVAERLTGLGYRMATTDPDCLLETAFTVQEPLVSSHSGPSVGVGAGGGSGGSFGGIGISVPVGKNRDLTGRFSLRVIDRAARLETWNGSIEAKFARDELTEPEVRDLVGQVLDRFPPPKLSPPASQAPPAGPGAGG